MAKNTGAKGFWRKNKGQVAEVSVPSRPESSLEKVEEAVEASPAVNEPETPETAEEPAVVIEHPQPMTAVKESWADMAARLAAEEEEKRSYAQAAVEEAKRAEAAFRRVEKEAALKQAEAKAQSIQLVSANAQQEATDILLELNRVEQAHVASLQDAEQRTLAETEARAKAEQELAELEAENQARLAAANQAVADLAGQMDAQERQMGQAAENRAQAENDLENAEAELMRVQNESSEVLRRMNKSLAEANADTSVISRQIAVLEERINNEPHSYELITSRINELEEKLSNAESRVADLEEKQRSLQEESVAEFAAQEEQINDKLGLVRQQAAEAEQRWQEAQIMEEQAQEELDLLVQQHDEGEQELRTLGLEREEYERQSKERLDAVLQRIDQARDTVARKKDQYQQAQKRVEDATAELVRVNALAKSAQEKLENAIAEEEDAKTAATMAQRLRADALAAKVNKDEAASMLLSKAESVLLSTIDSTNELLAEKTAARQAAEHDANYQRDLADSATAASNQATVEANDMIVVWLAAEESFVKTTGEVEAEKARLEMQVKATLEEYEDKRTAIVAQVEALAERIRAARQQAEGASLAAREAKQGWQMLQSRLDAANADYQDKIDSLNNDWDERLGELAGDLERARKTAASCQDDLDKARIEQAVQAEEMSKKLEAFSVERKELQDSLDEKAAIAESLEQEANEKDLEYKSRLQSINDRIEQLKQDILRYKETVSSSENAILELKKAHADALDDLEKVEKSCKDALTSLEQEHKTMLTPIEEARLASEERTNALAERLANCRIAAEDAVRSAAQSFMERLAAVNAVTICKVENQIAVLQENALPLQRTAAEERAILAKAEHVYQALNEKVVALRAEEERINNEADDKYNQLDETTAAALQEMETRLQDSIAEAEACTMATAQAKQDMEDAALNLEASRQRAAETARNKEEAEERLLQLEEEYRIHLAEAAVGLPKLLEEANIAAAAVTEQQVAVDEAEAACRQQAEVVDKCLQRELSTPQELTAAVDKLHEEKQQALNDAQDALRALEEKQELLQSAYAENCAYADKSELAKIEVEDYLQEQLNQQQREQDIANRRISEMEEKLAQLKEDAAANERAYREAEHMLADSSNLLQNASNAYSNAQIAAAKAQAELQSSLAAKETATALAQQASSGHDGMDKSTADILRKAAEGLFAAVDTAESVINEKREAYEQANLNLQLTQAELDRVRNAIGEAPQRLETSRSQWELAEKEYQSFQLKAEEEIPAIRKTLNAFLENRKADLAAAEEAVRNCREEAAINQAGVEKLNRQLMEIAVDISAAASDVQTIQLELADETAKLELESEKNQALRKEERLAAQALAAQLNDSLLSCRERLAQLRQEALEKKEQQRNADREYQCFEEELTKRYKESQREFCGLNEAVAAAETALEDLEKAGNEQEACIVAYEEAQRLQALAIDNREQLTKECAELKRSREAALKAASEEKLRLLGNKTIERIEAEDEAGKALADCQAKHSRCVIAEQRAEEIENTIRAEEEKLLRVRRECEEALRIARTKTSIFA